MAKTIQIPNDSSGSFSCEEVREVLRCGGVVAFPTDTFYGLGADPWNRSAVQSIFSIKKRPLNKPILVLISSVKQLDSLVHNVNESTKTLIDALWPGPLTLVFKARKELPFPLTAGSGKIGVRLPANSFTVQLIKCLGHPLTAPSANLSKAASPLTAREVEKSLGRQLPLIIDGGPCPGGKPSTILDVSLPSPKLLRDGAITRLEIEKALKRKIPPV